MAQDFHAAFGVGADDKRISTVDTDGVALAALQGPLRDSAREGCPDSDPRGAPGGHTGDIRSRRRRRGGVADAVVRRAADVAVCCRAGPDDHAAGSALVCGCAATGRITACFQPGAAMAAQYITPADRTIAGNAPTEISLFDAINTQRAIRASATPCPTS